MTKRIPHCPHCGSDHIGLDAFATWSADDNRYELASVYDAATCLNCERESDVGALDWRTADQPVAASADAVIA